MKTKISLIALVLAVAAAASWYYLKTPTSDPELQRVTAGSYQIRIGITPSTPRVGENRLIVELADTSGQAVSGASIEAIAEMPAMGAMSAMRAPANLKEISPGRYEGPMELAMRGGWPLTVRVNSKEHGEASLGFDMSTSRAGLQLSSSGMVASASGTGIAGADKMADAHHEHSSHDATRYTCPMHPSVQEPAPGQCPICGMNLVPADGQAELEAHGTMDPEHKHQHEHAAMQSPVGDAVSHYTCPMHPSVKSATPGQCPICGMDLTAVTQQDMLSGAITLDTQRRQLIGVTTAPAERRTLIRSIRAVGTVTYDETRLTDVNLKFDAWVGELDADSTGIQVAQGESLFTVYGPELLAAQDEYLETLRRSRSPELIAAARKRLGLWDIADTAIKELERTGKALDFLPIAAPMSGTVIDKPVVAGAAMKAGQRMLQIADLSTVWVEAQVYEADLAWVRRGMMAEVQLPHLPGRVFKSQVDYVYPYLEGATRTARVRLVLDNPEGELKPAMYAEVQLVADLGERLLVPEEAVLYAGDTRVVFVDRGEGRLEPRRLQIGVRSPDAIEVLEGLSSGEMVVTSGNFLVAAETRLKAGIKQW